MAGKMGSLRYSFKEKRGRGSERLLPLREYSSELPIFVKRSEPEDSGSCLGCRRWCSLGEKFGECWKNCKYVAGKAWEMGRSDPRKLVFSAKMGLALVLISLLTFLKEPLEDLSRYSVWAILTVVVVFEFSIGATLSKFFNRGLGTLSAGGLALSIAELCELTGDWEEAVIIISIFITGFLATYAKLYPSMKPYEYGFRVFLLTFCFIMVSGYRTGEFINTAVTRFILIAFGAAVCLVVNICIYPIWAGEDLHNLVAKNFIGVATSLDGCVNEYLNHAEFRRVPSKILTYQASDDPLYSGYRSAVESTSQEETLVGFAIWEPPHGPYKTCKYPWRNYVKVGGALRHCAFTVMALHGCILSEIQAPADRRQVFRDEIQRIGAAGAMVLRELGNKVKKLEKLGPVDILYDVHNAAEQLQKKVDRKSYLLVNSENWEIGKQTTDIDKTQDFQGMDLDEYKIPEYKSLTDLNETKTSQSWGDRNSNMDVSYIPPADVPSQNIFEKQRSWPAHLSVKVDAEPVDDEVDSKTYESASALSLATFTSLLIEFVARLQNLVDSFEELSEKANFKEPVEPPPAVDVGFWTKLCRCLWFWKSDEQLLV